MSCFTVTDAGIKVHHDSDVEAALILSSQHQDMLNDDDRLWKYQQALRTVSQLPGLLNRRCVDIGTGSGILSLFAAQNGFTHIDAFEQFPPMAKLAKEIVEDNHFEQTIKIWPDAGKTRICFWQ